MTTTELLNIRLNNHLLAARTMKEPLEVISWLGAMQSQSLEMAKWAIGSRLENSTVSDINEALDTGKIIRTHILRPTWHFVSAEDIHWMFDLSNKRLKTIYHNYGKQLGVNHDLMLRAVSIAEKALIDDKHLTKQELCDYLRTQGMNFDTRHMTSLIEYAEMEGVLCNGRLKDNKQTFTLLEKWAPRRETICREEALERLARRYFTSHGPATINDFSWWSGLSVTECRQAIEMIKGDFVCEEFNGRRFIMRSDVNTTPPTDMSALLLAPFDEFVVGYTDRSEIIEEAHYRKVMTVNGLFSPTVMLNGEIIGSWKRIAKKGVSNIELSFFKKQSAKTEKLFDQDINRCKAFYN